MVAKYGQRLGARLDTLALTIFQDN
jgi:hypothetical protein